MYKLKSIDKIVLGLICIGIIICYAVIILTIIELRQSYIALDKLSTCEICEVCESPYLPEERYLPETINCEMQLTEGDIIPARIYSPFGEWEMIIPAEIDYQLKYGARVIQCK